MNAHRFPFTVYRVEEGVTVTMNCGDGFHRSRNMPVVMLVDLVATCRSIRRTVIEPFRSESWDRAPAFPRCINIGGGEVGSCDIRVTVCRVGDRLEFAAAFYDRGDRTAPALLLIDDQIEEFVAKAEEAIHAPAPSD